MKWLAVRHVLKIHERAIEEFSGDPALLDMGRLESAVAQPRMTFGGQALYPTIHEKAAALAFSLCMNHPFQDGNKRTAYGALRMILVRNRYDLDATAEERVSIMLGVASGTIGRDEFVEWVRTH